MVWKPNNDGKQAKKNRKRMNDNGLCDLSNKYFIVGTENPNFDISSDMNKNVQ